VLILTLYDASGERVLKQWQFDKSQQIRIGRAPENQVVIDHPLVSRFHAELNNTGTWQLIGHGTNGTLVNGQVIQRAVLANGSLIRLAQDGPLIKFEWNGQEGRCLHEGNPPDQLFCVRCGQPVQLLKTVRDYQVLKPLAQGGMGNTYLAWNGRQMLVLKEMNAEMANVSKAQELFEREAKILKSLHHGGIPRYYDFFYEGGRRYLAMELIHGQNLEDYILKKGPIPAGQAIEWMLQLCKILTYIHGQQPPLIHRDVKPANLLVSNVDRQIFLLDFGAVKESGSIGGTRIGAPDYMAPEQNQGKPVIQSDLYAIGPTLIFLLTGCNPSNFLEMTPQGFRFAVQHLPAIPPDLNGVIQKATAPRIADRYASGTDLAMALATCR
jgi:serine/threonine protein kinase, bacterial